EIPAGEIRRARPAFQGQRRRGDVQNRRRRVINHQPAPSVERHGHIARFARGTRLTARLTERIAQKPAQSFAGIIREVGVIARKSIKLEITGYIPNGSGTEKSQSQCKPKAPQSKSTAGTKFSGVGWQFGCGYRSVHGESFGWAVRIRFQFL